MCFFPSHRLSFVYFSFSPCALSVHSGLVFGRQRATVSSWSAIVSISSFKLIFLFTRLLFAPSFHCEFFPLALSCASLCQLLSRLQIPHLKYYWHIEFVDPFFKFPLVTMSSNLMFSASIHGTSLSHRYLYPM